MIGGNARHSGKTTLACGLIRKFCAQFLIIGLKVTRMKPGESAFHGNHSGDINAPWSVFEELDRSSDKDTAQMLGAGACRVFFIRATEEWMEEALHEFFERIDPSSLVICESLGLRKLVKPGVFLLMMRNVESESGKDMTEYIALADEVCKQGNEPQIINGIIGRIRMEDRTWSLDKENQ